MTTPRLPDPVIAEERAAHAPSFVAAWSLVFMEFVVFNIGGLGLVFGHDGYFFLLYIAAGLFVLLALYGWWINIFEYTEGETQAYSSDMVVRREPSTDA